MPKLFLHLLTTCQKGAVFCPQTGRYLYVLTLKVRRFWGVSFFPIFFQGKCVLPSFTEGSCAECHWQKVQQDSCTGCFAFQHPERGGGHPKKLQSATHQREFPGKLVLQWCMDESTHIGLAPREGDFPISFCRHKTWPTSSFATFNAFCTHHWTVPRYDNNKAK